MKHGIFLSMFTDKTRLLGDDGFSLTVASQLNYVFGIQIRLFSCKPRGFLPGIYGIMLYITSLGLLASLTRPILVIGTPYCESNNIYEIFFTFKW